MPAARRANLALFFYCIMDLSNLESLVFISGPANKLPKRCQKRETQQDVYRPLVEAREGRERIYHKYNLPLFEILTTTTAASPSSDETKEEEDEGPAASIVRRRRRLQQHDQLVKEQQEDTSDEWYKKLHRKPEYVEKRIRTREIEVYMYARWQQAQQRQPPAAAATLSDPEGDEDVAAINEKLKNLSSIDDEAEQPQQKRPKLGLQKELRSLSDSIGFQEATNRRNVSSNSSISSPSAAATGVSDQPAVSTRCLLSDEERRLAHLGGNILEQMLVAAVPDQAYREFELPSKLYGQLMREREK